MGEEVSEPLEVSVAVEPTVVLAATEEELEEVVVALAFWKRICGELEADG